MCGKTTFVLNCLEHRKYVFSTGFNEIVYFLPRQSQYSNDSLLQKLRNLVPTIRIQFGLPEEKDILVGSQMPRLFIIDDQVK